MNSDEITAIRVSCNIASRALAFVRDCQTADAVLDDLLFIRAYFRAKSSR